MIPEDDLPLIKDKDEENRFFIICKYEGTRSFITSN